MDDLISSTPPRLERAGRNRAPLPDDAPHVLVVDDDSRIRTLLGRFLGQEGYRVTLAADAAEARRSFALVEFDCAVLDVMMPGEDGLSLAAAFKKLRAMPLIMLTARGDGPDRIRGLEAGADDYLAKPFEPRELVLRLRNLLRRRESVTTAEPKRAIAFGSFVFDLYRDELTENGTVIRLTDREQQLLRLFAESHDGTVLRDTLIGGDSAIGERTVDVQINRLRRKIEMDPANPVHLTTVRGVGYRLKFDGKAP